MFPNTRYLTGFLLCLLSGGTFGLIPLFVLPLMAAGIPAQTALVYRFGVASLILGAILWIKGEKLRLPPAVLLKLFIISAFYMLDVILFFYAFSFIPSGVAATLEFLNPVMVILIMVVFFGERFSLPVILALILAVCGVALLSAEPDLAPALDESAARVDLPGFASTAFWGVLLALLSGLCNALYLVGLQIARLPRISALVITFYVMAFGSIFCVLNAWATSSLVWIDSGRELFLAVALALVTAALSNVTLVMAIKRVGSALASILGVMEPLTAVCVGVIVFGEICSAQIIAGVAFVVASVVLVFLFPGQNA